MKAITYARYGPPEVLQLADLSTPVPQDDEVLIRVRAAEATKADCEMRSFRFSVRWFWLPLRLALGVRRPRRRILGAYFAGEVARVGKDVAVFKVGAGGGGPWKPLKNDVAAWHQYRRPTVSTSR